MPPQGKQTGALSFPETVSINKEGLNVGVPRHEGRGRRRSSSPPCTKVRDSETDPLAGEHPTSLAAPRPDPTSFPTHPGRALATRELPLRKQPLSARGGWAQDSGGESLAEANFPGVPYALPLRPWVTSPPTP